MLQSLAFCVVGIEVSGSLPCHPRRLCSPHPGKLGRGNLDFSLGSSFLNSPQGFIRVRPSLIRLGSPAGDGPSIPGAKPALLSLLGNAGLHFDSAMVPCPRPRNWPGWQQAGGEEGRGLNMPLTALGGVGDGRGELWKRDEVTVPWGVALVSWCKMPGPHIPHSSQWEKKRGKGISLPFKIQPGSYPQSLGSHPIGHV